MSGVEEAAIGAECDIVPRFRLHVACCPDPSPSQVLFGEHMSPTAVVLFPAYAECLQMGAGLLQ